MRFLFYLMPGLVDMIIGVFFFVSVLMGFISECQFVYDCADDDHLGGLLCGDLLSDGFHSEPPKCSEIVVWEPGSALCFAVGTDALQQSAPAISISRGNWHRVRNVLLPLPGGERAVWQDRL